MNNIFINTLKGVYDTRPPVWYMRQAGRVLPSYLKLREQHSFAELMADPELAARVTLLPVDDLDVDAAIIFSDILTVPVAMGMQLSWTERGPQFTHPLIADSNPLKSLHLNTDHFDSTCEALSIVKSKQRVPVIGFCGAPLTTLCYMLQGNSAKHDFPDAKKYFYTHRLETQHLVDAITEACIIYAQRQIESGADAFQLFETHAGIVPTDLFAQLFLPSVKRIADVVRSYNIPFIYFPKGLGLGLKLITPDTCDYVGIDWQTSLSEARKIVDPSVGLQGNIDPMLLFAPADKIISTIEDNYKTFFRQHKSLIINLGHGVLANTPIENLRALTQWIKTTEWL